MPQLTIITICRNIVSTIERTCLSIVNQTFQDFEWIVVDGASTDGTVDILKKYSSRIDILISEPDNGIYNAMNKGIKLATGEYILFMNGGDEILNFNTLENVFKKANNADVIYGDEYVKNDKEYYLFRNQRLLTPKSLYKKTFSHQATFVRTSIQKKYLFDESLKIAADYDFFVKIYFKKKYIFERIDMAISVFYLDGICSTNYELFNEENNKIHSKYFCFFQRYKFDSKYRNSIQNRIFHYKMILTHPRYIAGWIKRKLIK
ncbi:MAG: glycosyltransferase [Bacteroidales bacterium]|nr:glycosyltransferase [Bacteroidales bacterium]